MELEELKATWQSVKPGVRSLGYSQKDDASLAKKDDVKTRFLRKVFFGELFSFVCIILLATSHLWSPTKLPVLWLGSFCAIIAVGIICGIGLYLSIKRVNLWMDSNSDILTAIVKIKARYRRLELIISVLILPLLIWLSLTPPFLNTLDMYIVWALTVICFGLEYLWYRCNIKQLNSICSWDE